MSVALSLIAALAAAPVAVPPAQPPQPRVAVYDFVLEGEDTSPALALQLQDGFVIGLVRAGIQVLDSAEVAQRLQGHPELGKCESPTCLTRVGQLLEVHHLVRIKISVSGNSYRMSARLFGTQGSSEAVLPVANKLRPCDVCTVAEAREVMIRLADDIKGPLETPVVIIAPTPPPPRRPTGIYVGLAASVAAAIIGTVAVATADSRGGVGFGGVLLGAGVTTGIGCGYLLWTERRPKPVVPIITVAFRF